MDNMEIQDADVSFVNSIVPILQSLPAKKKKKKSTQENRNTAGLKDALLGPRQFQATQKPLKMMKNAFYFTLKALFVLKILTFLC